MRSTPHSSILMDGGRGLRFDSLDWMLITDAGVGLQEKSLPPMRPPLCIFLNGEMRRCGWRDWERKALFTFREQIHLGKFPPSWSPSLYTNVSHPYMQMPCMPYELKGILHSYFLTLYFMFPNIPFLFRDPPGGSHITCSPHVFLGPSWLWWFSQTLLVSDELDGSEEDFAGIL